MAERAARLIVCERADRWAAVWRGLLVEQRIPFWQTRSPAEAASRLRESPASVVALECRRERIAPVCRWIQATALAQPEMRAVVLAEPGMQAADCVLRAAGAHLVLDSPLQLPLATRWVLRHLRSAPRRELPINLWIEQLLGRVGRLPAGRSPPGGLSAGGRPPIPPVPSS